MKNKVTESLISTLSKDTTIKTSKSDLLFLTDYYHRLSGQDFKKSLASELRHCALFHREMAQQKKPGQTLVKIENQTAGAHSTQQQQKSVIYIVADDKPFLVNSLLIELNNLNRTPIRIYHPTFGVQRDDKHHAVKFARHTSKSQSNHKNRHTESYIQVVVAFLPKSSHQSIIKQIRQIFSEVGDVVNDYQAMKEKVQNQAVVLETMEGLPVFSEYGELFHWMAQDHFAFFGYCELALDRMGNVRLDKQSLLGIMRYADSQKRDIINDILPSIIFPKTSPLIFSKTRCRSNVQRDNYMDCILLDHGFKTKNATRKISCIIGFQAGSTATQPTSFIPHLRSKANHVLQTSTLRKGGYAYKELRGILETLPRDKLFQMDMNSLYALCMTLLNQKKRQTRLHIYRNPCGHFYSCLVYVPRELFNSDLRKQIQNYLCDFFKADEVEFDVYFSASILTRIHFIIHTPSEQKILYKQQDLESKVQDIARDWYASVEKLYSTQYGLQSATEIMPDFFNALPKNYQQDHATETAVTDISILAHLANTEIFAKLQISGSTNHMAYFKIYSTSIIALSDVLPILENMGLKVKTGRPYNILSQSGKQFQILTFEVQKANAKPFTLSDNASLFEVSFAQTWMENNENDGFNQLTLLSALSWRRVSLIRAYFRYLKQIRLRYSENYIIDALCKYPEIMVSISDYFSSKFSPHKSHKNITKLQNQIQQQFEDIATLDEERILRALLDTIEATLRTNYFQQGDDGKEKTHISFKLKSNVIPRIPEPAPKFEIFVYSPRIEGVHLRGGLVARGGLRWSDRYEDFRTEVLGLVKAQRVKNAVIVPVGSKGGFVAKRLSQLANGSREQIMQEVISCYQIYIQGLLDITDNIVSGKIIAPKDVVTLDGDDPYLVVAADKGTATFSDIANEISEQYGFWLGDAFASGGSAGYDHKKMGITARGAWESVKRHFRELGKDIQKQDFTVAGIGDMAGDVFGNGMLLSQHIRLVAAFNHQHIFFDPSPDAAKSYQERKRLFNLPRSSWTDYNEKRISEGGGVFSRSDKSIKLSSQMKTVLNTNTQSCTPNELIKLILKSDVELLWNGGIGTYAKSSQESHADAQDRNNDDVRVNANELGCKVIGEGGNLGFTQLSRIEFSKAGGLCYTDAIDNSAGVDTSDHEVNIKILLNAEIKNKKLTLTKRNNILEKMEQEVGLLVLRNNYNQTQRLSIEASFSHQLMSRQRRALTALEDKGLLTRDIEFLDSDERMKEREESGDYLTRPELAVLLSYGKMDLYQQLLDSKLPDNPYLSKIMTDYFPTLMGKQFSKQILKHRLKREIIATEITNQLVALMGPTFHLRMTELAGASAPATTASFLSCYEILGIEQLVEKIQPLDNRISTKTQMACLNKIAAIMETSILWILKNNVENPDIKQQNTEFKSAYETLHKDINSLVTTSGNQSITKEKKQLIDAGLPKSLSENLVASSILNQGLDLVSQAKAVKQPVKEIAKLYFHISEVLDFSYLKNLINDLKTTNIWHEKAKFSLSNDLRTLEYDIIVHVARMKPRLWNEKFNRWEIENANAIMRYQSLHETMRQEVHIDLSMLSVLVSELKNATIN